MSGAHKSDPTTPADPIVEINIRDDSWRERLPQVAGLCRRAASAAVSGARPSGASAHLGGGEISIVLADDEFVRSLNRSWRNQDSPTNVLAFPASDTGSGKGAPEPAVPLLGDVVVAFETTLREAADQGKTLDDHLTHLIVHGVLHLLGYDHLTDDEAKQMEGLETEVLSRLGIVDPYDGLALP